MPKTLHVFVDESGTPAQGDYFVIGAAWCVCETSVPATPLQSAVDSIISTITAGASAPSELKGAKLSAADLAASLRLLTEEPVYGDPSLTHRNLPWSDSRPVRFTIVDYHPNWAIEVLHSMADLSGLSARTSAPAALKTVVLTAVLNPLVQRSALDLGAIDQVQVTLDSTVWEEPALEVHDAYRGLDTGPDDVTFATRDSVNTPGLQVVDLAAYSWGRELRRGDCRESVACVADLRLPIA